jgi:formate dehydrogenase subunit gamma
MSATMPAAAIERAVALALQKTSGEPGPLLEILHAVQNQLGCVPPDAVPSIAAALNLSRAEVHGVISFYHHFRERPSGTNVLQLCRAEACQSMQGDGIAEFAKRRLGVGFGETREDGVVTLEAVYCLGLCACAPAAMLNGEPIGRISRAIIDSCAKDWGIPE